METRRRILSEVKKSRTKTFTEQYFNLLSESEKKEDDGSLEEPFDFDGKNITMEHRLKSVLDKFENLVDEDSLERETLISEAVEDLGVSGLTEGVQGDMEKEDLDE